MWVGEVEKNILGGSLFALSIPNNCRAGIYFFYTPAIKVK